MEHLTPHERDRLKGWIVSGIVPLQDLKLRDRDCRKWVEILTSQLQHLPHGKPLVIHLEYNRLSEMGVLALLKPFADQKVIALHCHHNQVRCLRPLQEWFCNQMKTLNELHLSHNLLCTPEILDLLQIDPAKLQRLEALTWEEAEEEARLSCFEDEVSQSSEGLRVAVVHTPPYQKLWSRSQDEVKFLTVERAKLRAEVRHLRRAKSQERKKRLRAECSEDAMKLARTDDRRKMAVMAGFVDAYSSRVTDIWAETTDALKDVESALKARQECEKCLVQNYTTKIMAHPKVTSYVCNFCTGMCAPGKVTKTYSVDEPDDLPDGKKVASYQHVEELRKVIDDLKKAKLEESLEEQAATLLSLPERMNLCHKLQTLKLPPLPPVLPPASSSVFVPTPHNLKVHVLCNLISLSGKGMGQFYAKKGCPWLDAVPFGVLCCQKHVTNFSLMQGPEIVFPLPRLNGIVPESTGPLDLQVALHEDLGVPFSVKMMISKGGPRVHGYTPPMGTVPLYNFCELETLLLHEVDDKALKDLELRNPEGPLAKRLLGCFLRLIRSKVGKRKLGEFRDDATTRTYILHMLIATDEDGMTSMSLRAKSVYNNMYTVVPVIEGDKAYPWDKRTYEEICKAIMRTTP
eukprot:s5487_g2.t1